LNLTHEPRRRHGIVPLGYDKAAGIVHIYDL
jgi:hypothetical protein